MSLYTVSTSRFACERDVQPLPTWWPAGLKGLYRDRSQDPNSLLRTYLKAKVSEFRGVFVKHRSDRYHTQIDYHTQERAKVEEWIESSTERLPTKPGWRVVKPPGGPGAHLIWIRRENNYSLANSTRATLRQRRYLDSREDLTSAYTASGCVASGRRRDSTESITYAYKFSGPDSVSEPWLEMGERKSHMLVESRAKKRGRVMVSAEKVKEVAASMGVVVLDEESATMPSEPSKTSQRSGRVNSPALKVIPLSTISHSSPRASIVNCKSSSSRNRPTPKSLQAVTVASQQEHSVTKLSPKGDRADRASTSQGSTSGLLPHAETQGVTSVMLPQGMQHGHAPSKTTSVPLFHASTAASSAAEHSTHESQPSAQRIRSLLARSETPRRRDQKQKVHRIGQDVGINSRRSRTERSAISMIRNVASWFDEVCMMKNTGRMKIRERVLICSGRSKKAGFGIG